MQKGARKSRPSDLTDDEKIERLWEALLFACMELKGDPADALLHALDIYNNKASEMLRMRKARKGEELDKGVETIGNVIAHRIMKQYST